MTGDITDSIGNTPLIEILKDRQFNSHLYVKLESFNPGGSIKDRVALRMISQCERHEKIRPGMELVEAAYSPQKFRELVLSWFRPVYEELPGQQGMSQVQQEMELELLH